jgi:hypothetical protein
LAPSLQLGFSDEEQIYAQKRTRRLRILDERKITVPWEAFLALIKPVSIPCHPAKEVVRRFLLR